MRFFLSLFKNLNTTSKTLENNENSIDEHTIYDTEEIATYFNISKKTVEEILIDLQWLNEKKLPTKEGIKHGAILKDDNTLVWKDIMLSNEIFISKINTKINTLIFALSQNYTKQKNSPSEYAYIA